VWCAQASANQLMEFSGLNLRSVIHSYAKLKYNPGEPFRKVGRSARPHALLPRKFEELTVRGVCAWVCAALGGVYEAQDL
jgi:hypothetical protein